MRPISHLSLLQNLLYCSNYAQYNPICGRMYVECTKRECMIVGSFYAKTNWSARNQNSYFDQILELSSNTATLSSVLLG